MFYRVPGFGYTIYGKTWLARNYYLFINVLVNIIYGGVYYWIRNTILPLIRDGILFYLFFFFQTGRNRTLARPTEGIMFYAPYPPPPIPCRLPPGWGGGGPRRVITCYLLLTIYSGRVANVRRPVNRAARGKTCAARGGGGVGGRPIHSFTLAAALGWIQNRFLRPYLSCTAAAGTVYK